MQMLPVYNTRTAYEGLIASEQLLVLRRSSFTWLAEYILQIDFTVDLLWFFTYAKVFICSITKHKELYENIKK